MSNILKTHTVKRAAASQAHPLRAFKVETIQGAKKTLTIYFWSTFSYTCAVKEPLHAVFLVCKKIQTDVRTMHTGKSLLKEDVFHAFTLPLDHSTFKFRNIVGQKYI